MFALTGLEISGGNTARRLGVQAARFLGQGVGVVSGTVSLLCDPGQVA